MPKKILVVDDEPSIHYLLQTILEGEGYAVEVCEDGRRVREKVAEFKPDLVLLDVMLPGTDGFSIAKAMSGDPEQGRIPVVVLTALDASGALFKDLPQVKGFLTKPVKQADLLEKVSSALAGTA